MKKAILASTMLTLSFSINAQWLWTDYMEMNTNYIHPLATGSKNRLLVITVAQDFHSCGWNQAGNINSELTGEELYDSLTAAFLSAWMANKKVSLLVDGCDSDRAKVIGMRIAK